MMVQKLSFWKQQQTTELLVRWLWNSSRIRWPQNSYAICLVYPNCLALKAISLWTMVEAFFLEAEIVANLHLFPFPGDEFYTQNLLSNCCWHKYSPSISRIFLIYPNCLALKAVSLWMMVEALKCAFFLKTASSRSGLCALVGWLAASAGWR